MSIDCTFYSDDKTTFHIDIDDEWESEKRFKRCPTLTIKHGEDGKALHFMSEQQLRELRDLLDDKVPDQPEDDESKPSAIAEMIKQEHRMEPS